MRVAPAVVPEVVEVPAFLPAASYLALIAAASIIYEGIAGATEAAAADMTVAGPAVMAVADPAEFVGLFYWTESWLNSSILEYPYSVSSLKPSSKLRTF